MKPAQVLKFVETVSPYVYNQSLDMIIPWYRRFRLKRKSRKLIKSSRKILSSKRDFIEPKIVKSVEDRISELENSMNSNDYASINDKYESLKKIYEEQLSGLGKSKLRQNVEAIFLALLLALFVRTFIVQPFKIPSGSMIPTLLIGDHLLVNKFAYGTRVPFTDTVILPFDDIRRGDIVVFKFPDGSEKGPTPGVHYIKRIVAVEGDELDIRGNELYINGERVEREYAGTYEYDDNGKIVSHDMYTEALSERNFNVIYRNGSRLTTKGNLRFPVTIDEGHYFALGDNRDNSWDSRFWGFVPEEYIAGRAFLIHWSWDLSNPNIFRIVRWDRLFSTIE